MKLHGNKSYDLKIQHRGRYLHAVMTGIESIQQFMDAWKEIAKECQMQACSRILCEGCLEGTGMAMGSEEYGKIISEIDLPVGTRIAVICSEERLKQVTFEERSVTTRIPVLPKIFFDAEEGINWLTK